MVVLAEPLTCAWEFGAKPLPRRVMIPDEPALKVSGATDCKTGTGLFTVTEVAGDGVELPPPGAGFETVICRLPFTVKSAAGNVACSDVEPTNVVGRLVLFTLTIELETNPVPVTFTVVEVCPTFAAEGETPETLGDGLLIVNVADAEPPPGGGLVTVTCIEAAFEVSELESETVICVALTNVELWAAGPSCTVEEDRNPVPLIVSEVAPEPAVTDDGDNPVTCGTGLGVGVGGGELSLLPPQEQRTASMTKESARTRLLVCIDTQDEIEYECRCRD